METKKTYAELLEGVMRPVTYPTDYVPGEVSDNDAYMTMADAGITPEQVTNKKERAAYEKYLKAHKE